MRVCNDAVGRPNIWRNDGRSESRVAPPAGAWMGCRQVTGPGRYHDPTALGRIDPVRLISVAVQDAEPGYVGDCWPHSGDCSGRGIGPPSWSRRTIRSLLPGAIDTVVDRRCRPRAPGLPRETVIYEADKPRLYMVPVTDSFRFDYFGSDVVYGRGCIGDLDGYLGARGLHGALVVCGSHVGANEAVMQPLRRGLADRLVGVFDETTPTKAAETVYDGIAVMRDVDPDVLIGVGGGSSLDVARQMSAFAADGRPLDQFREAARTGRTAAPEPDGPQTPVIVVPTTFAGADISDSGSILFLSADESPTGQPIRFRGSTMPTAMVYDPNLFETTPAGAIARSAMNGFNKAVETTYARTATPITDATAVHALRYLHDGYLRLGTGDPTAMERAVIGMILAQFRRQASIVHSFGHAFSARYPVQQGLVHAVIVPHVLRYVFGEIDGRRGLVAQGLGIVPTGRDDDGLVAAIIDEVVAVRDSFDLPTRLREIDVVDPDDFGALAEFVLDDYMMDLAPEELDPSRAEIEGVLEAAW